MITFILVNTMIIAVCYYAYKKITTLEREIKVYEEVFDKAIMLAIELEVEVINLKKELEKSKENNND